MDLTGPASQVADSWRKWKRAFEYYAEGKGINNIRKKTSQLLHFAGMEVQDIFEDLQDPGPIPEACDNAYNSLFASSIPTFVSRRIFLMSTMFFFSCYNRRWRPLTSVRLRNQVRHCNFGTSLNDNLRDQLIKKLTDFELKRKLLEQRNNTLEEVLDKAHAWEAAG